MFLLIETNDNNCIMLCKLKVIMSKYLYFPKNVYSNKNHKIVYCTYIEISSSPKLRDMQ